MWVPFTHWYHWQVLKKWLTYSSGPCNRYRLSLNQTVINSLPYEDLIRIISESPRPTQHWDRRTDKLKNIKKWRSPTNITRIIVDIVTDSTISCLHGTRVSHVIYFTAGVFIILGFFCGHFSDNQIPTIIRHTD